MKMFKILTISLLLMVTQVFAWGQAEQKALLGFTAGVALTHFISTYDNNSYMGQRHMQRVYQPEEESEYIDVKYERYSEVRRHQPHHSNRTTYINNYYNNTYYNAHRRQNHYRSNRVIVKNHYRNNYYY